MKTVWFLFGSYDVLKERQVGVEIEFYTQRAQL